jgi:hypothetical protein
VAQRPEKLLDQTDACLSAPERSQDSASTLPTTPKTPADLCALFSVHHLPASQRAVISLDVLPMLEEEAKERLVTSTGGADPRPVELFPQAEKGRSRDKAAEMFDTNPRYVSDAKKLQEEAPDLLEQVKTGEMTMTIPQAKK